MAKPWDANKIKKNLKTLAQLKSGNKVQFLSSGEIRTNSFAIRRRSSDSITSTQTYNNFDNLFTEAVRFSKQAGDHSRDDYSSESKPAVFVTMGEIENAIRGVEQLRGSYSGDNKKLQKLNLIINRVKNIYQGALNEVYNPNTEDAKNEIRDQIYETYRRNLLLKVDHHHYLGIGEAGICMVFTMDWIRRSYVDGKETYAMSGSLYRGFFPKSVEERLHDKVENRFRPISSDYYKYDNNKNSMSNRQKAKWHELPYGRNLYIHKDRAKGVQSLTTIKVRHTFIAEGLEQRRQKNPRRGEGKRILNGIVSLMKGRVPYAARRLCMFHLNVAGSVNGRNVSHSVGFKLAKNSSTLHFFDSNMGEFLFDVYGGTRFGDFAELWWKFYSVWGFAIDEWTLYEWTEDRD